MKFLPIILGAFFLASPAARSLGQGVDPTAADSVLHFIVVGDWGHRGEQYQKPVAVQMAKTASEFNVRFIISTGDNFYPHGVVSIYDTMWKRSFENVYTDPSLQVPWYAVLGNHDYHSNPEPQIDYSSVSKRWHMPARYYAVKFDINGDSINQALFVFIDTNPFIPAYYRGTKHKVHGQDTEAQKKWITQTLSDPSPNIRWRIVVGHHPMFTGGGRRYLHETWPIRGALHRVLRKAKVDAYLAGHEHSLQHLGPIKDIHHFISGSGATKTKARRIFRSKFAASEYGFMLFSLTGDILRVRVIDHRGNTIYTAVVERNR